MDLSQQFGDLGWHANEWRHFEMSPFDRFWCVFHLIRRSICFGLWRPGSFFVWNRKNYALTFTMVLWRSVNVKCPLVVVYSGGLYPFSSGTGTITPRRLSRFCEGWSMLDVVFYCRHTFMKSSPVSQQGWKTTLTYTMILWQLVHVGCHIMWLCCR